MKITKERLLQIIKEEIESYPATRPAKRRVGDDDPDATRPAQGKVPSDDEAEDEFEKFFNDALKKADVSPAAELAGRAMARKRATDRERREHRPQAEKLWDILYPDDDRDIIDPTITSNERGSREPELMTDLFAFISPDGHGTNRPNPLKMNAAEEWIKTRSGKEETALRIGKTSKEDNIESLAAFIDDKLVKDVGMPEFRKSVKTKESAELSAAEKIIKMVNKRGGLKGKNLPDLDSREAYKFGREKYVSELKRLFPKEFEKFLKQALT